MEGEIFCLILRQQQRNINIIPKFQLFPREKVPLTPLHPQKQSNFSPPPPTPTSATHPNSLQNSNTTHKLSTKIQKTPAKNPIPNQPQNKNQGPDNPQFSPLRKYIRGDRCREQNQSSREIRGGGPHQSSTRGAWARVSSE